MTGSAQIPAQSRSFSRCSELSEEQEARLTDVLDRYLCSLEADLPLEQEALIAAHPDLADPLRVHFRSLDDLHRMAAGFSGLNAPSSRLREMDEKGRIGDFELLREIGRGGMGVVYEARQISLDRHVAVKLLPFAAVLDAKQITRFKTEAQAAAQVQHPNIVPVFAIGVERGIHYYAMQLINGQPLDRAIADLRNEGSGFRAQGSGGRRPKSKIGLTLADIVHSPTLPLSHSPSLPLSPSAFFQAVARLGIQAAEALHAAHEYGV